jgi:hypothetical protein
MKKQHLLRVGFYGWFCVLLLLSAVSNPARAADITGDGVSDLIIGVPHEAAADGTVNAGAVATLRGAKGVGLTGADQLIFQGDAQEISELGDAFGSVLAVGDFNDDGIYDAAVGVPNEGWSSLTNAGVVQVIYGKTNVGLDVSEVDFVTQDDFTSIGSPAESNDAFGSYLASGDFDGDGYDDLAISVPNEDLTISTVEIESAGIVHVIYGSWEGLNFDFTQSFYQDFLTGGEVAEAYDYFGRALTAGDFNNDGNDDLVIGVQGEDLSAPYLVTNAGAAHIVYGHANGLGAGGSELIHQDFEGTGDEKPELQDSFGAILAVGDFDCDYHDDLVVGLPAEAIGTISFAGAVQVFYGDDTGIDYDSNELITQFYIGESENYDVFGFSLAVGDFNGHSCDDLAVGAPGETPTTISQAGEVDVFYGNKVNRLYWHAGQVLNQGGDYGGAQEVDDQFGYALAGGNFNGDHYDDLAVGVPNEDIGTVSNAGAVQIFFGAFGELTHVGVQIWHQDSGGIRDSAEAEDQFGRALAAIPGLVFDTYLPAIVK